MTPALEACSIGSAGTVSHVPLHLPRHHRRPIACGVMPKVSIHAYITFSLVLRAAECGCRSPRMRKGVRPECTCIHGMQAADVLIDDATMADTAAQLAEWLQQEQSDHNALLFQRCLHVNRCEQL